MKRIILGEYIGFCSGVRRCISFVEKELEKKHKVYAFGVLLHNEQEIKRLEKLGVKVVNSLEEIKNEINISLIIRAHGIERDVFEEISKLSNINLVDGTCPIVKKNQKIVQSSVKENFNFIIYGDKNHPEIKALLSYITKEMKFVVISCIDDIEKVNFEPDSKIALLAQTTKPVEEYNKISEILKKRYKKIKVFNTICKETILREQEATEISKKADAVIIIGGKNSSNTKKLALIANRYNKNVFLINSEDEIEIEVLDKYSSIGIVAGASTPYWLVKRVVDKLNKQEKVVI